MNAEVKVEEVEEEDPSCCWHHDPDNHDEPDRWEPFQCPETDSWYRYCTYCGWEQTGGRWMPDAPTEIHGQLVCYPGDHDYEMCYGCDEWQHCDDIRYSYYDDNYYCRSCYRERGTGNSGERVTTCHECHSGNVHLDELREKFVCDCKAQTLLKAKHPVKLARELVAA